MGDSVQNWQLLVAVLALIGGWLTSYNILKEKVIRLEEKVNNHHENHSRTETAIKEMKATLDKIWERMEKKVDK